MQRKKNQRPVKKTETGEQRLKEGKYRDRKKIVREPEERGEQTEAEAMADGWEVSLDPVERGGRHGLVG